MATRATGHDRPKVFPRDDRLRPHIAQAIDEALGRDADAIILYGSRSRGDHRPDSDWDVLIIVSDSVDLSGANRRVRAALDPLIDRFGTRISPLVLRWRDTDDHVGILRNVIDEGVPLI